MAFGIEVALVLRAKGGQNFLTQTQGVGIKDSVEATQEVMEVMKRFKEAQGARDGDGQGNNAPGYASGQLLVCKDRLLVTYRLVNGVWVMTVTPAVINVLMCSQIIAATTRLLVAACKGIDVTPDKIARKYPEIYMALGQVLSLWGVSLDPGTLLAAAEGEVLGITPEGARQKAKGPAAAVKSRLGLGVTRKGMTSAPSSSSLGHGTSPDPSFSTRRRAEESSLMGQPFVLPEDALTPQATADPVIAAPRAAPAASTGDVLDDLFGPPVPVAGAEFLAGTGLETLEAPAIDYGQFADLATPAPPAASDNPWADFDTGLPPDQQGQVPAEPPQPPKPALPPPTSKQQRSIANGNALQLVELWRAFFVGGKLEMAGTSGEVLASGTVPRCAAEAALQLRAPEAESEADVVAAVVESARGDPALTTTSPATGIVAQFSEATSPDAAFVKYSIPAMAVQPPLLAAVSVAERPKPQAPKSVATNPVAEPGAASSPGTDGGEELEQQAQGEAVEGNGLSQEESLEDASTVPTAANGASDAAEDGAASGEGAPDEDPTSEAAASLEEGSPAEIAEETAHTTGDESPKDNSSEKAQAQPASTKAGSGGKEPADAPQPATAPEAVEAGSTVKEQTNASQPATAVESVGREHMVVVSLAVRPDLPGPLRGVCVDLDLHYSFGDVLKAQPPASFSSKQRRLRWNLFTLEPGAQVRLRVLCRQAQAGVPAIDVACKRSLASVHAFGPPGEGLSGISLFSGATAGDLRLSRTAFHCEVFARPEMPKQRAELTKKDMLAMALQMHERLTRSKEADGEATEED